MLKGLNRFSYIRSWSECCDMCELDCEFNKAAEDKFR